jgi:hypothetical protein
MVDVIKSYLANIERELKTGKATGHTHRPALKDLLEGLNFEIKATNEPKRVELQSIRLKTVYFARFSMALAISVQT